MDAVRAGLSVRALGTTTYVNRQQIPRGLRIALYGVLIIAGISSVPMIGAYGPLPMTNLLDAWFGVLIVTTFLRGKTPAPMVVSLILLAAYALTRVMPAIAINAPVEDFVQAYRWVIYLFAFVLALRWEWGPVRPLIKVTWALIGMALVKSLVTELVAPEGARPGLLLENNFELALFSGLVAVIHNHLGRGKFWIVVLLGALTVLSGSRSGAVAFLVLALYAITQIPATRVNLFQRFLLAAAAPLLVLVPVLVFASRAETVRIDRLNFLDVFFYETREWNLLNWLFGTIPITPLTGGCSMLRYYTELFASTGDGSCYAVILHAFILRVIFDAGLVGAAIAFGVIVLALIKSGAPKLLTACLLLIALTNSMSVSGPNNPYVALPVLLAILVSAAPKPHPPACPG